MHRANTTRTTATMPADIRKQLEDWARHNVSSLTAELVRSVRERAERERRAQCKQERSEGNV